VEPDAMAMARAKQENRLGSARKLRDILRAKKARLTKDKT
jgi:bifunctional UDP-N-acetylglucosamine pyrophosphorylase/glucosamine-1-phosphate N-acetyltransferase